MISNLGPKHTKRYISPLLVVQEDGGAGGAVHRLQPAGAPAPASHRTGPVLLCSVTWPRIRVDLWGKPCHKHPKHSKTMGKL